MFFVSSDFLKIKPSIIQLYVYTDDDDAEERNSFFPVSPSRRPLGLFSVSLSFSLSLSELSYLNTDNATLSRMSRCIVRHPLRHSGRRCTVGGETDTRVFTSQPFRSIRRTIFPRRRRQRQCMNSGILRERQLRSLGIRFSVPVKCGKLIFIK